MKAKNYALADKQRLLIKKLRYGKTANEAIQSIFEDDLEKGTWTVLQRGWKFYVHLNKLLAPLEREGRIEQIGVRGNGEKVWRVK